MVAAIQAAKLVEMTVYEAAKQSRTEELFSKMLEMHGLLRLHGAVQNGRD